MNPQFHEQGLRQTETFAYQAALRFILLHSPKEQARQNALVYTALVVCDDGSSELTFTADQITQFTRANMMRLDSIMYYAIGVGVPVPPQS